MDRQERARRLESAVFFGSYLERASREYVTHLHPLTLSIFTFRDLQLKIDQRVFMTPSKRKLDVNIVQSNFHIEMTPSDVGNFDRVVIQDLLKEIAQTQQVDLNAKQRFKGTSGSNLRLWALPVDDTAFF